MYMRVRLTRLFVYILSALDLRRREYFQYIIYNENIINYAVERECRIIEL